MAPFGILSAPCGYLLATLAAIGLSWGGFSPPLPPFVEHSRETLGGNVLLGLLLGPFWSPVSTMWPPFGDLLGTCGSIWLHI